MYITKDKVTNSCKSPSSCVIKESHKSFKYNSFLLTKFKNELKLNSFE